MILNTCGTLLLCALPLTSPEEIARVEAPEALQSTWVSHSGGEGPGQGKHIVLIAGDEEYRSEEALPQLAKILAKHHGFRCTVLFSTNEAGEIDPEDSGRILGLEHLVDADMMVLFTRFRRLPDEHMKYIADYVESGKPLLGIRTATHAFNYEKDSTSAYADWGFNRNGGFGRRVLGETWVNHHGHHGHESTAGVIPVAARAHPILRGVEGVWGPTDVYGIRNLPEDSFVLLEGAVLEGMSPDSKPVQNQKNDPRMPISWLRNRPMPDGSRQRVVCTTIGAATDFESEGLRRFFVNSCYWGVGLEARIPERSKADLVGTYEPSPFGFGTHKKGVRPEAHAGLE